MINVENALELNEIRFEFNLKGKIVSITYSPTRERKSEWYGKIEIQGVGIVDEFFSNIHTIAQKTAKQHIHDYFKSLHK